MRPTRERYVLSVCGDDFPPTTRQDGNVAREGHPPQPSASTFALQLESIGKGILSDAMNLLLSLLRQVSKDGVGNLMRHRTKEVWGTSPTSPSNKKSAWEKYAVRYEALL